MKVSLKRSVASLKFFVSFVGKKYYVLIVLSLISGLLDSVGITMVFPLFELLMKEQSGDPAAAEELSLLTKKLVEIFAYFNLSFSIRNVVVITLSIFFLKALIKFSEQAYKIFLSSNLIKSLRDRILDRMGLLRYRHYANLTTGRITNVATVEAQRTISAFIFYSEALLGLATGIGYIIYVFTIDRETSLITILFGILYFAVYILPTRRIKRFSYKITENNSAFGSLTIQIIQSFKYLKATAQYSRLKRFASGLSKKIQGLQFGQGIINAVVKALSEPIMLLFVFAIFAFQIYWMEKDFGITLVVLLLFYRCFGYLIIFQNQYLAFTSNIGGLTAVQDLLNELDTHKEVPQVNTPVVFEKEIRIQDLSYSYIPGVNVLNGINITIRKNETVAFVGRSGSGKSTLIDILSGLLEPEQGQMLLDGQPLRLEQVKSWQKKIGYITQENILFNDTVANNISLWQHNGKAEDHERMQWAIKSAHCDVFIDQLQNGLESGIGERGMSLSGGQRQRLSIARELYKRPEVLILDEATSALDSESERYIQNSIDELKGHMTIVIVAHRLSTVRKADRIYVLDQGHIVEYGSYDELVGMQQGIFHKMIQYQEL